MIYIIAALCAAVLFLLLLGSLRSRTIKDLRLQNDQLTKLTDKQKQMLERMQQRENIDSGNVGLGDTELDERLQNELRD